LTWSCGIGLLGDVNAKWGEYCFQLIFPLFPRKSTLAKKKCTAEKKQKVKNILQNKKVSLLLYGG
jgi:hypothetical protein